MARAKAKPALNNKLVGNMGYIVDQFAERYQISTYEAIDLFAECLGRNLIIDEFFGMADFIQKHGGV